MFDGFRVTWICGRDHGAKVKRIGERKIIFQIVENSGAAINKNSEREKFVSTLFVIKETVGSPGGQTSDRRSYQSEHQNRAEISEKIFLHKKKSRT